MIEKTHAPQISTDFDVFWRAYPRKHAKGDARKAWHQTAAIRPPVEQLLAAIDAAKRSEQWRRDGGQYIPYPATWLRGERWEDEHEIQMLADSAVRPWHETASGIEAKGRELGLTPEAFPHFAAFKVAVMQAARGGQNVVQLRRRA